MPIQAPDNRSELHERSEIRFDYRFDDSYTGSDGYRKGEEWTSDNVKVQRWYKDTPVDSDHHSPTNWRREVGIVVEDTPLEMRQFYRGNGPDWFQSYRKYYISRRMGQFAFLPLFKFEEQCTSESVTKALQNLKGGDATMLGADVATAKQTVDMLSTDVMTGVELFRSLRRWDLPRAARALGIGGRHRVARSSKQVANWWLEYHYGWKPLADSIYSSQTVLSTLIPPEVIIRGRGFGKSSGTDKSYNGNDVVDYWNTSSRTTLEAAITNPNLYQLSQLGVINPLSIAWELVPWSFAIDWFVPVGNVLDALTARAGLSFRRGWTSKQSNVWRDVTYPMLDRDSSWTLISPGKYSERMFGFRRSAYGDFPRPSFYADQTPFSTPRALNALALVRQLFR